jgi:predicted amidophosphoribosyltransferase
MRTFIVADRPTALDHKLAELQGIYLCEGCGKELLYPKDPQLCGRCEEALDQEFVKVEHQTA